MNKIVRLLIAKFIIILIANMLSISLLSHNSISWSLAIALPVTAINFIIGDLLILSTLGNITASVSDGIVAALVVYTIDSLFRDINIGFRSLLFLILLITVGEYLFHQYLLHYMKLKSHRP